MARRTKEDALATRDSILDAAAILFVEQGVSRTTLAHIAAAAGVTRGAIYWHFEDKAAMFNAMMERATTPLESAMAMLDQADSDDPLGELHDYAVQVFKLTVNDPEARRAFEIATLKMELTDEMTGVRERRAHNQAEWIRRAEGRVRLGIRQGHIKPTVKPRAVALGIWVLIEGLIRNWLIGPEFNLLKLGAEIVGTHLDSLRPLVRLPRGGGDP
ncbi:MAG: TetR family transcriptional regulator [Pseudomonadota bacterium]